MPAGISRWPDERLTSATAGPNILGRLTQNPRRPRVAEKPLKCRGKAACPGDPSTGCAAEVRNFRKFQGFRVAAGYYRGGLGLRKKNTAEENDPAADLVKASNSHPLRGTTNMHSLPSALTIVTLVIAGVAPARFPTALTVYFFLQDGQCIEPPS